MYFKLQFSEFSYSQLKYLCWKIVCQWSIKSWKDAEALSLYYAIDLTSIKTKKSPMHVQCKKT